MEAPISQPVAAAEQRRSAPGRLELVRQFINTADLAPGEDEWSDLNALRAWLRKRQLIGTRERLGGGDLERAMAVRETLRTVLEDRDRGEQVDAVAIGSLNALGTGALLRVTFDRDGLPLLEPAAGGLDRALGELFAIVELAAADGSWSRLKVCADHGCRWAFYDHSKNRSRNWCNMAVCGNRAKARQYRRRQRSATAEGAKS
jgi:predicted RNA-binding Zn ribbon-like protein